MYASEKIVFSAMCKWPGWSFFFVDESRYMRLAWMNKDETEQNAWQARELMGGPYSEFKWTYVSKKHEKCEFFEYIYLFYFFFFCRSTLY